MSMWKQQIFLHIDFVSYNFTDFMYSFSIFFLMESLGFFYIYYHVIVPVYFLFNLGVFCFFFSSLLALIRAPNTELNTSVKHRRSYLVLGLRGKALHFSPFRLMLSVGLS